MTAVGYDNLGRRLSVAEGGGVGTSTWSYDSLGRTLTSKLGGSGAQVAYDYDLAGNNTKIVYPTTGNPVVTRCFDELNRLRQLFDLSTQGAGAACTATTQPAGSAVWTYDYDHNITGAVFPGGTTNVNTYDPESRMLSTELKNGATSNAKFTYTRTNAGRLKSTLTAGTGLTPIGTENYSYDQLNQLQTVTGAATRNYTYDNGDNPTRLDLKYQQFNAGNQLCWQTTTASANACGSPPAGATTFGYDAHGNRSGSTTAGVTKGYGYDQQNRLTSTTGPTASTYQYVADGTRTSSTIAGVTTNYTYTSNGGLPQMIVSTVGATVSWYVYGPDGQVFEDGTTTRHWLFKDQIGSVRVLTGTAATVVGTYSFDPHGNQTAHTGTTPSSFLYTGELQDAGSGLYYLRARYYDPTTGQFINRDPAYASTLDPYGYVSNNFLNLTDPTGLCGWSDPFDCVKKAVKFVEKHKEAIVQTVAVAAGVVAVVASGGAALGLAPIAGIELSTVATVATAVGLGTDVASVGFNCVGDGDGSCGGSIAAGVLDVASLGAGKGLAAFLGRGAGIGSKTLGLLRAAKYGANAVSALAALYVGKIPDSMFEGTHEPKAACN